MWEPAQTRGRAALAPELSERYEKISFLCILVGTEATEEVSGEDSSAVQTQSRAPCTATVQL